MNAPVRYFLDKNGGMTLRMKPKRADGHYEIAQEVLPRQWVAPADYADHYEQMFRLKYVRIVEHEHGVIEVEHRGALTSAQERFIRDKTRQGRRIKLVKVHRRSHY